MPIFFEGCRFANRSTAHYPPRVDFLNEFRKGREVWIQELRELPRSRYTFGVLVLDAIFRDGVYGFLPCLHHYRSKHGCELDDRGDRKRTHDRHAPSAKCRGNNTSPTRHESERLVATHRCGAFHRRNPVARFSESATRWNSAYGGLIRIVGISR